MINSKELKTFKSILQYIKEEIGDIQFAMAFSSVELVSLQDNVLVFGVPADFFKESIEKKHLDTLKRIALEKEKITEVRVVLSDQKNATEFFPLDNTTNKKKQSPSTGPQIDSTKSREEHLHPAFQLENFIVGPSNAFAYSIAKAISANPGYAHNPCLIYGNVGLGKTHLIQAIGNKTKQNFENYKVLYYPSETFLNEFIYSIEKKSRDFKQKIRSADVLLIDDVQFFANKPTLQEEFYHTFNALIHEDKQMIFTSDRPVHKIRDLEERLQSRFRSNMVVDLQTPEPEVARGIINKVLNEKKITGIADDVIDFIVERMRSNIRDMIGILGRIEGFQNITGTRVDLSIIRQWNSEYSPKKNIQKRNTVDKILSTIASYYEVSITELKSQKRNRKLTHIRHIAIYILREQTKHSFTDIGKILSVSHVSASKSASQIEKEIELIPEFAIEIEELIEKLHQQQDFS